jgi:fructokinase
MPRIGVDLGGTKIEVVALDDAGRERLRERRDTPCGDYDGTLRVIAALVGRARQVAPGATIGVGVPGAPSLRDGTIKNANSTVLIGQPLADDLQRLLGQPVRLDNDANCFAMSEAVDGAGAGARVVFGVILGTGVGGGLIVDRRPITGVNAIAGEWGHNPLPPIAQAGLADDDDRALALQEQPGPRCYCGRFGCVETWLSGPGLQADFRRATGRSLTVPALVEASRSGDADARAALGRYVDRLARALATVINVVDPDVIVLGGGLSAIDELYRRVPQRWARYVFSDRVDTRLVRNRHGDSSGVRGAAWLWPAAG